MDKKSKIVVASGIILALILGFWLGVTIDYPGIGNSGLSGTIGKVNNYRNSHATEADIELQNELLTDSVLRKSLKFYFNYYYTHSVRYCNYITFAFEAANSDEKFKTQYADLINNLGNYLGFLEKARKDLLFSVAICSIPDQIDPVTIRNSISGSNNLVAQLKFRNQSVIEFITVLESYILQNSSDVKPSLVQAHDLLTFTEIGTALNIRDKALLRYLDKKKVFGTDMNSIAEVKLEENFRKDFEQIESIASKEELSFAKMNQAENLQNRIWSDTESVGRVASAIVNDFSANMKLESNQEILGSSNFMKIRNWDSEKLGWWDGEKLSLLDSEKLGWFNAETLNSGGSPFMLDLQTLDSKALQNVIQ